MRVIKHGQSALCVYIDICMDIDNHLGHGKFQYLETNAKYTKCVYYHHNDLCPDSTADVIFAQFIETTLSRIEILGQRNANPNNMA